jgi:hypothetical protein
MPTSEKNTPRPTWNWIKRGHPRADPDSLQDQEDEEEENK